MRKWLFGIFIVFLAIGPAAFNIALADSSPEWVNGQQTQFTGYTGSTLTFTVRANDPDNGSLVYGVRPLPPGASFATGSGNFSWTPTASQEGVYYPQFSVTNGKAFSYLSVRIQIEKGVTNSVGGSTGGNPISNSGNPTGFNNNPYFVGFAPATTARVNQLYSYDLNAVDPDNEYLIYSIVSGPAGLTINQNSGFLAWVPLASQIGSNLVTVGVSDSRALITQSFQVLVENSAPVPVPTLIPSPISIPTPTPAPQEPAEEKVIISNLRINNEKNGDIIVSWNTNIPTISRVIFDTESQADRTRNFSYKNATPNSAEFSTSHSANLGNLKMDVVYYLRAVSKTNRQTVTSQEVAFVKLPAGVVSTGLAANLFGLIGAMFNSPGFIVIILIVLGILVYLQNRKIKKMSSPL